MTGRPPPPSYARSSALHEAYGRPFSGAENPPDPRVGYSSYFPPDMAPYYSSTPSVLPGARNDVLLQPRAYGLHAPAGVINPALPGLTGLPAGASAQGPSALEVPSLAGLSGLVPAREPGPSHLEERELVARSSSLGTGAGISVVERDSPLPKLDGPSEDESNILFVDCLPTDCTRREVAHLFRPFHGFKDIRLVHKEPRRSGDKARVLCFVEFENAKFAHTAMKAFQGYRFDDRKPDTPVLNIQFTRFPFRLPGTQDYRKR